MLDLFTSCPLLPVVVIDEPKTAVPLAQLLNRCGFSSIEVTMRTPAALQAVSDIRSEVNGVKVGVGTIVGVGHARDAVEAGASFLVAPGLHLDVVEVAKELDVPIFPGVATATEVQAAWNLGLRVLKFFPAEQLGGVDTLSAFASVFPDVRFIPTGGISPANLTMYLRSHAVVACGCRLYSSDPAHE